MDLSSRKIIIAVACLLLLFFLSGCGGSTVTPSDKAGSSEEAEAQEPKTNQAEPAESPTETPAESPVGELGGLQINDKTVGTGTEAANGDRVTVHYTGRLSDGTKFDSSLDRDQPFEFVLGEGRVIQGWEKGVLGMKVGGQRELVIPPEMGYGAQGAGDVIPPNAVINFDIELLEVQKSGQ